MKKKPLASPGRSLHALGLMLPNLPTRFAPLTHRGPALALLASATVAAAALCAGPGPLLPVAVPTPSPMAVLSRQAMDLAQPGYLVSRGSAPQASSRGGRPMATMPPTPTSTPASRAKTIITYQVAAGETVDALAKRFGITPETIAWANGLDVGAALQPGQTLTILPISGVLYRVQAGDTLNGIAQAYGVDAAAIAAANDLASPDALSVDQTLVIPGGRPLPTSTPSPEASATPELTSTKTVEPSPTPELTPTETPNPTPTPELTLTETATPEAQPSPAADAATPEAPSRGDEIVAIATQYLGYPYAYGGASPSTGFDCSGFTQFVYAQAGISLPRTAAEQATAGPAVALNDLLPGDLVIFADTYSAGISHVGIYVGDGRMIHAANATTGVCYDLIGDAYWSAHYYSACRPWS